MPQMPGTDTVIFGFTWPHSWTSSRFQIPVNLGPVPTTSELGLYLILSPIAGEFASDPMSVQCFDLRIVAQARWVVQSFERQFGDWLASDQAREVIPALRQAMEVAANGKG